MELPVVEDNNVVETLAPDASKKPLHNGVQVGRLRRASRRSCCRSWNPSFRASCSVACPKSFTSLKSIFSPVSWGVPGVSPSLPATLKDWTGFLALSVVPDVTWQSHST